MPKRKDPFARRYQALGLTPERVPWGEPDMLPTPAEREIVERLAKTPGRGKGRRTRALLAFWDHPGASRAQVLEHIGADEKQFQFFYTMWVAWGLNGLGSYQSYYNRLGTLPGSAPSAEDEYAKT